MGGRDIKRKLAAGDETSKDFHFFMDEKTRKIHKQEKKKISSSQCKSACSDDVRGSSLMMSMTEHDVCHQASDPWSTMVPLHGPTMTNTIAIAKGSSLPMRVSH